MVTASLSLGDKERLISAKICGLEGLNRLRNSDGFFSMAKSELKISWHWKTDSFRFRSGKYLVH